jgi:hypothetical protein
MRSHFPLFHSHLDLAHNYWNRLLQEGDWAIDATCGNGHDTLKLAQILLKLKKPGGIIGIDIQPEAIARTNNLLKSQLSAADQFPIQLFCQSHTHFPAPAAEYPIRLVIYNLGYLPQGDKQRTTMTPNTLESVRRALDLIIPGGAICITCYPGHAEGAREESTLLDRVSALSPITWNVCYHTFVNRSRSPSLLLIQKTNNNF